MRKKIVRMKSCIFPKIIMQYCINALLKNDNEIMQYYIINTDIALVMHYRALLQMPDHNQT